MKRYTSKKMFLYEFPFFSLDDRYNSYNNVLNKWLNEMEHMKDAKVTSIKGERLRTGK